MIGIRDFNGTEMEKHISIWTPEAEAIDLAAAADIAVRHRVRAISCAPGAAATLWPWLENTDIKIMPRFYLDAIGDSHVAQLSGRINLTLRQGASGAQIFVRAAHLGEFARSFASMRDDLFLNRDLEIGLDIGDVESHVWGDVFSAIKSLRATAFIASAPRDAGNRSDVVGRLYAMLDAWNIDNIDLHFAPLSGVYRAEQAWRLAAKMRPELINNIRFFAVPQL